MLQLISCEVVGSCKRKVPVDLRFDDRYSDQPIIIFVHGFKGFKDWGHFPLVLETLAKTGSACVSFNFTHNGTTLEKPTEFGDLEAFGNNNYGKELFDLRAVISSISSGRIFLDAPIDRQRIFLFGHSRGGAIALIQAAENKAVKGLATWASVSDLKRTGVDLDKWRSDGVIHVPNARTNQQMPMYYQFVEDFLTNEQRYSLQYACARVPVPSLFIHGTEDRTVPSSESEKLHSWTPSSALLLIDGTDHTFGGKHPFREDKLPPHSKIAVDAMVAHFGKREFM